MWGGGGMCCIEWSLICDVSDPLWWRDVTWLMTNAERVCCDTAWRGCRRRYSSDPPSCSRSLRNSAAIRATRPPGCRPTRPSTGQVRLLDVVIGGLELSNRSAVNVRRCVRLANVSSLPPSDSDVRVLLVTSLTAQTAAWISSRPRWTIVTPCAGRNFRLGHCRRRTDGPDLFSGCCTCTGCQLSNELSTLQHGVADVQVLWSSTTA